MEKTSESKALSAESEGGIEVTPEMIEAGVCALESSRGSFCDADVVSAVYTSMALQGKKPTPK